MVNKYIEADRELFSFIFNKAKERQAYVIDKEVNIDNLKSIDLLIKDYDDNIFVNNNNYVFIPYESIYRLARINEQQKIQNNITDDTMNIIVNNNNLTIIRPNLDDIFCFTNNGIIFSKIKILVNQISDSIECNIQYSLIDSYEFNKEYADFINDDNFYNVVNSYKFHIMKREQELSFMEKMQDHKNPIINSTIYKKRAVI